MALRTDSSQVIYYLATVPSTSAPFSMGGWFYLPTTSVGALISVGAVGANNQRWTIIETASPAFECQIRTTSTLTIGVGIAPILNAWNHVMLVEASATDHRIWINGVRTSDVNSKAPTAGTEMRWGVDNNAAQAYSTLGIAHQGLWNIALADEDVFALAFGAPPMMVRPDALQMFWAIQHVTIPQYGIAPTGSAGLLRANVGFLWAPSDSPLDLQKRAIVRRPLFSTVPAAPTGRIWKLAAKGGGLVGVPRGLAG